jgi:UDP:flavonoid glycosyltransferase YjiC (YdhE family)
MAWACTWGWPSFKATSPHLYDQFFWAHRAQVLRIGASIPTQIDLTSDAMTAALREVIGQSITSQVRMLASRLEEQGAIIAAERLDQEFS